MKTWIDFDDAPVFAIPLTDEVDERRVCEGMLIEGPQGWGEFSPPRSCDDRSAARWLTAAIEAGTVGWPDPVRGRVPVAVTVPAVDPGRARQMVAASGCRTAAVTVARPGTDIAADADRLEAVRDALGPGGAIRCDADGGWDLEEAARSVPVLNRAAGGLEFVEQPCATLPEIAALRRRIDIPVAVDQSVRNAVEPHLLTLSGVADIAVLTVSPLGGVRRALRVAESCGLPCVVAGAVETSVGTAGGLALAGVLPDSGFAAALAVTTLLNGDVVSPGRSLVPTGGYLPVAPMPPAPDLARLGRWADAETQNWWRGRLKAAARHL